MDHRQRAWIWAGLALTGVAGVGVILASTGPQEPEPAGAPPDAPKPAAPPGRAPLARGQTLLIMGDSLAQGLTLPLKQLSAGAGVTLISNSKVGSTASAWASSEPPPADVALVSLGTNDMRMLDPSRERAAFAAVAKRLSARAARVIWLAPPPMPFPEKGVRALIAEAAESTGAEVFPPLDLPRGPDGIHPTAAGFASWAGLIWRWIG